MLSTNIITTGVILKYLPLQNLCGIEIVTYPFDGVIRFFLQHLSPTLSSLSFTVTNYTKLVLCGTPSTGPALFFHHKAAWITEPDFLLHEQVYFLAVSYNRK